MYEMDEREMGDLVRQGAARWRGAAGSAAGARFAQAGRRRKLRYAAAMIGAAAALFMGASAMAGAPGPGSFLESLLGPSNHGTEGQPVATEPSPSTGSETKIVTGQEPTPSTAQEPTPATGSEPTPTPGHEPTPTPGHEPTPTPGHEPTPTPGKEPAPTPTAVTH